MKPFTFALLFVLFLTPVMAAEDAEKLAEAGGVELNILSDFEAGSRRAIAGDHKMARIMFEQGAKKGDAQCMFGLGTQYYFGEAGKKDLKEARRWWEMSLEKGHAPSAFMLAAMYRRGEGMDANPAKANELLQLAANRCVLQAQNEIANRLYDGDGLPKNKLDAIAWLSIAATHKDSDDETRAASREVVSNLDENGRAAVSKLEAEHRASLNCPEQ